MALKQQQQCCGYGLLFHYHTRSDTMLENGMAIVYAVIMYNVLNQINQPCKNDIVREEQRIDSDGDTFVVSFTAVRSSS
jgi:hypothetical protein